VAEVFAGFVAGYGLAIVTTPLFSVWLLRLRAEGGLLARLLPAGTSPVGLSLLLHGALAMFWTGLGLVLGLVLFAMRDGEAALGSKNGPFTLFVAGVMLAIGAPLFALFVRQRGLIAATFATALVVYGWLTPYLAEWSRFE